MTKRKKLITALIAIAAVWYCLIFCIVLFLNHTYAYLNTCIMECAGKACALADYRPVSAEMMNTRVDYEMLSEEYKKEISYEQYTEADTPEELLSLWSEDIFRKYPEIKVDDQRQSTTCYKKQDGVTANFEADGKWYFLKHEIDFEPDFRTLDVRVVRWHTEIREISGEDLPVLY